MATGTDSLKRHLDELKQALADAEAIDPHTLAELREALDGIDRQLDRAQAGAEAAAAPEATVDPGTMVDRLTGGAYRLEASHPDLALALHRIAESLSEIGI